MKLIKLSAIESTNSYLKEMNSIIQLEDEIIVWTNSQTNGRGQMGASWYSEPGKSLTFSMLKRYSGLPAESAVAINLAVSLGVASALDSLEIPGVKVKWPNDIMSANKKIAGILIENQLKGEHIASSVIGIGINVNNEKFVNLPKAGSLFLATDRTYEPEVVLRTVAGSILMELGKFPAQTLETLKDTYESMLFRKGIASKFQREDGSQFMGEILGVNHTGDLQVIMEDASLRCFQLKEIELLY